MYEFVLDYYWPKHDDLVNCILHRDENVYFGVGSEVKHKCITERSTSKFYEVVEIE